MISVIVPIYNVAKYLKECLDSIITQNYSNIEIILVDDGSTDTSGEICEEYKKKDNRIKVIHKRNGGLSDARNAGIAIATGEYLSFIDSDDLVNKDMLSILMDDIKKYNTDIAACRYLKFYDSTENIVLSNSSIETIDYYDNNLYRCMYDKNGDYAIVAWNKLYKKELFNDIKYPYGKIHEDEFVIHKLLDKSNSICFDSRILYYYRQRKNSITYNYTSRSLDVLDALEDRLNFYYNKKREYDMTYKSYMFRMSLLYNYINDDYIKKMIRKKQIDKARYIKNCDLSFTNKILLYTSVHFPKIFSCLYRIKKR